MIAKTLKLFVTLKAGMQILSFIGDRGLKATSGDKLWETETFIQWMFHNPKSKI
ncbi:hypothetical protein [Nostoc sp.]|uniref:hypothetical protein n=1 Tax=Nostoc sp. TaxID=1180 RepID=UPI002FFCEFBF